MIDILNDIEILEQALIGIKDGHSDEKNIALASLENFLQKRKLFWKLLKKKWHLMYLTDKSKNLKKVIR